MRQSLQTTDISDLFHMLTAAEIHAAVAAIKVGNEKDQLMGQGYILAIERARTILRDIMKDVQ